MTWGQGFGLPWGGGPLVPVEDPLSPVGGLPTSFDFSDEPNGALPGLWETYILDTDAAGNVAVSAEPDPPSWYKILGGLGLWNYSRSPAIPPPASAFQERGVAASPSGVLVGRNAQVRAILLSPVGLPNPKATEFFYEVVLGLRFNTTDYSYVGGRARARWVSGVWVEPITVEAVQASGQAPAVLATAPSPDLPDDVDAWRASPNIELSVTVRYDRVDVSVNGVWQTFATVPADGPPKIVLEMRVYNRLGAFITPVPVLAALSLQSFRDLERLGPPPQLPGDLEMEAATLPMLRLPIQGLLDVSFLKQIGARRFQATRDFEAEDRELRILVREGEVMHAREPFVGQALVPVTRDLAFQRNRGGL